MTGFQVRKALVADLPEIKNLADQEKEAFGFITRGTIRQAIELGQIVVVVGSKKVVGFQHYYHRKRDGQTTLYHKVVAKKLRGIGLGRMLVDAVVAEAKAMGREKIILKCPVNLPSNEFHRKYGFELVREEAGRKRKLNVWGLELRSRRDK